jgi:hypothetical protein
MWLSSASKSILLQTAVDLRMVFEGLKRVRWTAQRISHTLRIRRAYYVVRCDKIEEAESNKVGDRDCKVNVLSRESQSRGRKDSVRCHFRLVR